MNESRIKTSTLLPTCQICSKVYDNYYHTPRVLPKCGHTYCEKCIKAKLQQKRGRLTFTCPQCQSQTQVRKCVQDELPKNITIADLVKDVKFRSVGQQQKGGQNDSCDVHGRKLEMVCMKCGGVRVCSHCALFGAHKGHQIANQANASKQDINQLSQCISIIQDTINQILLPNSPTNLQKQSKSRLTSSIKSYIKQNFKQYYQQISKRQEQLLQQCQSIVLDQKSSQYVDDILNSFDILKIKGRDIGRDVGRKYVEQMIEKAKQLHNQVERVVEGVNKSVDGFLLSAKIKIKDCAFFQVQMLQKRSLKAILKQQQYSSPIHKQKSSRKQDQSTNLLNPKKLLPKQEQKPKIQQKVQLTISQKSFQQKKEKEQKVQAPSKLRIMNSGNSSRVKTANTQRVKQSNNEEVSNFNSNTSNRLGHKDAVLEGTDKQKIIKKNNSTVDKQLESTNKNVVRMVKGESSRKHQITKTPDKNAQRERQKSPIQSLNEIHLKFTKPIKQLNYQLRSKFQSITTQIDRQHPQGTLQLIGLQINDHLIPYICEYLLNKKLKFSMIKLVKNQITDEGLRILLSYLITDTYTKVLNLTSNQLTAKSLPLLQLFVNGNNICKTIYISNNKVNIMQLKKYSGLFQAKFVQVVL